uniref:RRM domain-containing protein n=1 Tax=Caenorhabditis tropicalis TaxID=1561998 RepID=A0A1I7TTK5_9PELO
MSVIIRLKNLPITAGASDVRTFFSGLKIPDGAVHIIGGDEGDVFVGFASDEDARIAMTRDRSIIHGAEIRLLLSSKSEQNSVIAARRNGTYGSPEAPEEYVPPVPSQPPQPQQNWNTSPSGNPYAAKSGYEASYPPQNSAAPRTDFNNQNNYSSRGEISQNDLPPFKAKDQLDRDFGGFKNIFHQQGPPSNTNRFVPNLYSSKPPEALNIKPVTPQLLPSHIRQTSPERDFPIKGNKSDAFSGNHFQGAVNERQTGGDSWRDNSYNQTSRNSFKNDYKGGYNESYREDFKNDFNGEKPFNQLPPRNVQHPDSRMPIDSHIPPQTLRKTLMPNPSNSFQGGPHLLHTSPNESAGNRPFQSHPPAVMNPQQNGPPPFRTPAPMNNVNPTVTGGLNRIPHPFQGSTGGPSTAIPAFSQLSVVPPVNAPVVDKFYIELTRLPNDLLRPASLEAFIRPTTPLTLSSVKTVFGPGGIHMYTIIRLESIADYATMMRRNGEQGIKIQQSDKKAFDAAIDGVPIPGVTTSNVVEKKQENEDNKKGKRSRWETKSPQRSPRKSSPRRDQRDRSRSRSPPRRRRRSRSPRRREEHTDPTRWCIQITNVPFRMKEEELLEWFAEKVRPAKLVRTYYSDGNASDRWIAEFSSESLMRRSFSIRTLCSGRSLKLSYIDNDKADEILRIEDVYGEEKRHKNESARMQQEEAEKANPPSFFNAPSTITRGPIATNLNTFNGPMKHPNGMSAPIPNGLNGLSPNGLNRAPGNFNAPPMRGGFAPRGNGFPPPRGGMMVRGGSNGDPSFGQDPFRGGFRGGFRGRGGGRGGFQGNFRNEDIQPTRNEFIDLVKSIGPRGTVLSCFGFPNDVTLEDVVDFFSDYEPDRNSIRIRRTEDGVMTGECMLACFNPENARRASLDLNGQKLRNFSIAVRLL